MADDIISGSIRRVNPAFGTLNCVNCAIATDATLAGRPACALPGSLTSIAVLERLFGKRFMQVNGKEAVDEIMREAGQGARAIIYGERVGGVGHVFNATNQNGIVRYLDGQTGRPVSFASYQTFRLLRTN